MKAKIALPNGDKILVVAPIDDDKEFMELVEETIAGYYGPGIKEKSIGDVEITLSGDVVLTKRVEVEKTVVKKIKII